MSTNSTLGVSTMQRHDEYYFRDGNICFLVENTVFRLHRFFFERESEYFRDYLALSSKDEDGSPDSPYRIHDIKSEEFADFVWVWYNPRYSFSKQEKKKWLTILRLATNWGFGEMRKLAIRHLEKINLEPIEKITTYKLYAIDDDLLLPSYMSLCSSPTLPSPEEGKRLTLETILRLASAREQVLLRASEIGCRTPTIAAAPEDIVKAVVTSLFGLTIHSNDQSVRVDSQATNNGDASSERPVDANVITIKNPKKPKPNGDVSEGPSGRTATANGTSSTKATGKHRV